MRDNNVLLGQAPIGKLIVRYAVPSVIGLVLYGLQNVIDGILVGRYMGSLALASVNLITPVYAFIGMISIMTGVGCQALMGIALGRKDNRKATDAMTTGFVFVFLAALFLFVAGLLFSSSFVSLLGADEVLHENAVKYLQGLLLFAPFIALMFYADCMLKITGYPRYALFVMLATVMINTLLNLLFIRFTSLGVMGVGLATGIAFTFGFILSSIRLLHKGNMLSVFSGKFNPRLLKEMLYNGSSEGLSELAMGISILMFNHVLMRFAGADGVAAFSLIGYIFYMGTTVFLGISDGIVPILSYNYGRENYVRVKRVFRYAAIINLVLGVAIFIFIRFFAKTVVGLFLADNHTPVMDMAVDGAGIYVFAFLFNGFNILVSGYFTALANARFSLIISSLRGLVLIIIGLFFLPSMIGITGIWLTVPLAEIATCFIAILLLKHTGSIIFDVKEKNGSTRII
ncbi:MAG: MATE family efflux transporter [Bacteroidales bacterium]